MWQGFNAPVTSIYDPISLLPLGLYMRTDITGRDPSKWKVTGWVYNNVFYPTLDDFRKVINQPNFKSLGMNVDEPWAHTKTHGDAMPLDIDPPPAPVRAGKERFSVDEQESYVTWSESIFEPCIETSNVSNGFLVDFSFYVSLTRDNGLRLFDVRYKGKRILYEVS